MHDLEALVASALTTLMGANSVQRDILQSQLKTSLQRNNSPPISRVTNRRGTWASVRGQVMSNLDRSSRLTKEELDNIYAQMRKAGYKI